MGRIALLHRSVRKEPPERDTLRNYRSLAGGTETLGWPAGDSCAGVVLKRLGNRVFHRRDFGSLGFDVP